MNHITDDYGRDTIAVGAEGSLERVKVQYPRLIDEINALWFQAQGYREYGASVDQAIQFIRDRGIKGRMETENILKATHYGEQTP